MSERLLVWFGVFGPPTAWVVQFLLGYGVTQAQCNPAGSRSGVPIHTWTIAATVVGATVAMLGWLAALAVFRATRDAASAPPRGRVHFLSVIALTTSPLFLLIIVWGGVGALVLQECHQA